MFVFAMGHSSMVHTEVANTMMWTSPPASVVRNAVLRRVNDASCSADYH
jgi:hypothetical protein